MKRRFLLFIIIGVVLTFTTVAPSYLEANSKITEIEQRMKNLEAEGKRKEQERKRIERDIQNIKNDQVALNREISYLDFRIEDTIKKMEAKQVEIDATEEAVRQAAIELDEAIARVEERDKLLRTRVRAMYETGEVSYLELLLDAKSIGDFLSRVDFVQRVVDSDVQILEDNIRDKERVEEIKAEIEAYLAILEDQYSELFALKIQDEEDVKLKTAAVARLEQMESDLEDQEEELANELAKIAAAYSKAKDELNAIKYFNGEFTWPVPDSTRITSNFGYRIHPISKVRKLHNGIDIGAPQGTAIVAGEKGEVILAEMYGGFGNTVMINHGGGMVTLYAHIRHNGIKVKVGQVVERGEKIAEVGSTGVSTGPHLHFSVIKDGEYVDPMKYLGQK